MNTYEQISVADFTGAEDWFEFCFYVDWNNNAARLFQQLERVQEYARDEGKASNFEHVIGVGRTRLTSLTHGARLGGKKGPYMDFMLEHEHGITFIISRKGKPHKTIPNVMVRVDGECCLAIGAQKAFDLGRYIVEQLGGDIERNKLSRVDVCLDMPDVGIHELHRAFKNERYICRSNAKNFYESPGISLGFGIGSLTCRVYEKHEEVKLKANPYKKALMIKNRWNGKTPAQALRVEFQMRRDTLKGKGIDTVEDYYRLRSDLVRYLCFRWLRFTSEKVDRENKNQSRAKTHEIWVMVQDGFMRWAGSPAGQELEPLDRSTVDISQLIKQAAGVLKSAANYKGKQIANWQEFARFALPELKRVMAEKHNIK
ncbi:MAG: hypothetical protein V5783_00310 [Pontiella sp.]